MKAIRTKTIAPTNTKGTRIKASDADGNFIVVSGSHSSHADAARQLVEKMGWAGTYVGGSLGDDGYVFVPLWPGDEYGAVHDGFHVEKGRSQR